ncbi:MAG: M20/M25/M40 family metallo-hydrolase [Pseudomonadales bacterium]|nr:M20/M25/M40 family metallo-hydrolase [Pseudomonadales bacterium]
MTESLDGEKALNPSPGARASERSAWLALLAVAVVGVLGWLSMHPPAPVSAAAPATEFSAERAIVVLRRLLGDETPHPVGSAANRAVRDRLVDVLEELGLEPQVQRTVGCSGSGPLCARVENVIAAIPGQRDDTVMLMAHYDSVPHAPGAADDGSGVVALLETARALLADGPTKNRILLVFTDAEEVGLLGAEAFFAEHPLAAQVKAVINMEGSGSRGPSLLLRATSDGGRLVRLFKEAAPAPVALSVAQEIFARMPNDTDFSVAERAGFPAIDFSFAYEFNHYHTPLDTIANLDPGSVQHHGENLLPLVKLLRDMSLEETAPAFSYLTVQQKFWLSWPATWNLPLALAALLLPLLVIARVSQADRAALGLSLPRLLAGLGIAGAVLLLALLLCFGLLWLADQIAGTRVNFPANPWPWRLLVYGACGLSLGALGWWLAARLSFWPLFLGAWTLLGLFALTLAVAAPLAANLLLVAGVPAAVLATVGLSGRWRAAGRLQSGIAIVALALLAYSMLTLSFANEETQGWRLAPAIFAALALLVVALIPLRPGRGFVVIAAVALLAGLVWSGVTDLYSPQRPQHVSLHYVLDRDSERAQWAAIASNPLPKPVRRAGGKITLAPARPWSTGDVPHFDAPVVEIAPSEVLIERDGNRVKLQYRRRAAEAYVLLVIPEAAGLNSATIEGRALNLENSGDNIALALFAPGDAGATFELTFDHDGPVSAWLADGSNRLPLPDHNLVKARGELAVPQHRGDQRIAYRVITL